MNQDQYQDGVQQLIQINTVLQNENYEHAHETLNRLIDEIREWEENGVSRVDERLDEVIQVGSHLEDQWNQESLAEQLAEAVDTLDDAIQNKDQLETPDVGMFNSYLKNSGISGSSLIDLQDQYDGTKEFKNSFILDVAGFFDERFSPDALELEGYLELDDDAHNTFLLTGDHKNPDGDTYVVMEEPIGSLQTIIRDSDELQAVLEDVQSQLDSFIEDHPDVQYGPLSEDQMDRLDSAARSAIQNQTHPEFTLRTSMVSSMVQGRSIESKINIIENDCMENDAVADSVNERLGFDPEIGETVEFGSSSDQSSSGMGM